MGTKEPTPSHAPRHDLHRGSLIVRASKVSSPASNGGRTRRRLRCLLAFDHQGQHHHVLRHDADSRIADPRDPTHIFSWLICESYDDKATRSVYEYAPENGAGVPIDRAHERNRTAAAPTATSSAIRTHGNRSACTARRRRPRTPVDVRDRVRLRRWTHDAIPVPEGEHERVQLTGSEPPADAWASGRIRSRPTAPASKCAPIACAGGC